MNTNSKELKPIAGFGQTESLAPEYELLPKVKVIVLGRSGVGKTALTYQLIYQTWKRDTQSTIPANFCEMVYNNVRLALWDTAGQERFDSLTAHYYRGAMVALIVYDLTDGASFQSVQKYIDRCLENEHPPSLILVSTKGDLVKDHTHPRAVPSSQVKYIATQYKLQNIGTSSKTGDGLFELRELIAELGAAQLKEWEARGDLVRLDGGGEKKGCCS